MVETGRALVRGVAVVTFSRGVASLWRAAGVIAYWVRVDGRMEEED
jgi:hypothetical protein